MERVKVVLKNLLHKNLEGDTHINTRLLAERESQAVQETAQSKKYNFPCWVSSREHHPSSFCCVLPMSTLVSKLSKVFLSLWAFFGTSCSGTSVWGWPNNQAIMQKSWWASDYGSNESHLVLLVKTDEEGAKWDDCPAFKQCYLVLQSIWEI